MLHGVFRSFFKSAWSLFVIVGLAIPGAAAGELTVSWSDNSDNETGFRIERSTNGATFSEIAVVDANTETYTDTSVAPLTTYWYRVRAYNGAGNSAYSGSANALSPPDGPMTDMMVARGNGVWLTAPSDIDTSGLVRVEFYSGSTKVGESTSDPYYFLWSGAPLGVNSVSALAVYDDATIEVLYEVDVTIVEPTRTTSLATRGVVGGNDPMIVGFKIDGSGPQRVLIRAVGEGLENFGVTGVVGEPSISLSALGSSDIIVQRSSGWDGQADRDAIAEAIDLTGVFALQPGSRDAAILVDLAPGQYTAVVGDASGVGGVCLLEAYLVDDPASQSSGGAMSNLATRGYVGRGGDIMIAGLNVDGRLPKRLLIRGVGPGLSQFGVSNPSGNPQISIFAAGEEVPFVYNDDWSADPGIAAQIANATGSEGAFSLTYGSTDSAVLVDLDPGTYTIQLSSANGALGTGLIEVYEVSP